MTRSIVLVAILVSASPVAASRQAPPPAPAAAPADTRFHAVAYVEVSPASTAAAVAALTRYRDTGRTEDGYARIDVFEQAGRRGRFAVVETWRDQAAFDAHAAADQKTLFAALDPIRISGYDQRPYRTLTTAEPRAGATGGRVVSVVSHVDVSMDPRAPAALRRLADASRQEPGNVRFVVLQHAMRANHFTVVETWRDEKAYDAHVTAAHTKQYRDEIQPLTGSPLDERVYRGVE